MSDTVISVEGLSKRYLLGAQEKASSFREAVSNTLTAPWRRLGRLAGGGGTEEFWALRDVSFEVKRGEVVGVIGRNGAGKSTLLKVLSRITPPTAGRIRLKGRVASLLEVGTGFHPELTGRENIYLNGAILGMSTGEIRRKFDEIVAFSEVEKFLDTPVKRYSSGMYVRLAFAVAAHLEPEILIVDEVLAVGDAAFQRKCVGKMKEVSRGEGRTVLFVSHQMPTIQRLTTKCIWLDGGQLKLDGPTAEVTTLYFRSDRGTSGTSGRQDLGRPEDGALVSGLELWADNEVSGRFPMGTKIVLRLSVHPLFRTDQYELGLAINSEDGVRICSFNNLQSGQLLHLDQSVRHVECDLGDIPLMPGRYSFKVTVSRGVQRDIEQYEEVCPFEVEEADVFNSGKVPSKQQGHFYWPAQWSSSSRAAMDNAR